MLSPRRITALALTLGLTLTLGGLTGAAAQAAPAQSGPYVRDTVSLAGGTGRVLDVATLKDDSVFVASSVSNGTGVLDIMDNPGDNITPDDDSLTFSSGVLGVAANQVDDTAYFVTDSSSVPAGVTWITRTSVADNTWSSVAWGNGMFVAVAGSGTGNRVMTSPDGITWTLRSSAADNNWNSVTWGGPAGQETFVAVAGTGTGDRVMTSPDGITWTTRASASDNSWSSVTWGGPAGQETFVAVAISGTGDRVMTSPDGITWTPQTSAVDNFWYSVAWGGPTGQETFVAVAINGTGNRVMTSATIAAPAGGRAALWSYAHGAVDDSAPLPGTGVGGAWADVAVNNADDTVYVASQDDTRIIAFRGSNLDDSRSIALPAGTTPYALAVNQADDTVYVLSYGSGFASYLTAMRGADPDDSTTVALNMVPGRQALAINPVDGTVYVGGWSSVGKVEAYTPGLTFMDVASIGMGPSVSGLAVSGDGRRLCATADNGSAYLFNTANFTDTASVSLDDPGVTDDTSPGAVAIDDYGWAWTASPSYLPAGTRSLIQIGTAPTFTSITPGSGLTSGGYTATITGSWFTPATTAALGVEANLATVVNPPPTSNSMTVTVPPGAASTVDVILINVAGYSQPLGVNDSGSFTYVDPPPPTYPPSPPLGVTAVAGDASATIAWTAPANPGSFPVSNYSVTASPSGKTCLTSALTCQITGLTNGTTYTFTVKALNGAGWSAESAPSNAVTPKADTKPLITIVGSRSTDGTRIEVRGTTTDLVGREVRPWVRFPGQVAYAQGTAVITVATDGAFTWSRKTKKKSHVYFTHESAKSNTVTIAAR